METRKAFVTGILRDQSGAPFHGWVILERHPECVYYTWRLETNECEWLCTFGHSVSFHVIPVDQNVFDFALLHAIEGLRRYRFNRKHLFDIARWEWSPE